MQAPVHHEAQPFAFLTAGDVVSQIRANCENYHARLVDHEAFTAEQRRLWDAASSMGFVAEVVRALNARA